MPERFEPHNEQDSGWCFSSGQETQEYLDDAANMTIVRIDTLLEICPALEPILEAPPGSYFQLEEGDFMEV